MHVTLDNSIYLSVHRYILSPLKICILSQQQDEANSSLKVCQYTE
uniref:Uncharacterized protein n=1 Tax=Anguilla anguilla TaxID=7936 RepID=A0A0E9UKF6_ANGAN